MINEMLCLYPANMNAVMDCILETYCVIFLCFSFFLFSQIISNDGALPKLACQFYRAIFLFKKKWPTFSLFLGVLTDHFL